MAVLVLGLVGGCGSDGNGGEKPDSGDDEDGGGPGGGEDGGLDSGEEEDADAGPCEPKGCDELGYECGEPEDGCGGPLDCGNEGPDDCVDPDDETTAYFTCGGGGEDYKCGCTPKTCEGELVCGTLADGCGGVVECGADCASEHDSCGGGGTPNECGCAPDLAACGAAECGTADDACGGEVACGEHDGGCSDARKCNAAKKCECKPQAELCDGKCGVQHVDGCPPVTCPGTCPACDPNEPCANCTCPGAGAICADGECCTPEPKAATCDGAVCGERTNNCGQTVECGDCATGLQCTPAGQCADPKIAALVGTYAVHTVGFAIAAGQPTRSEALSLVTISQNGAGLVMKEQACWSSAYLLERVRQGNTTVITETAPINELAPAQAEKLFPTTIPLELTPNLSAAHQSLPGTKDWVRGKQSAAQNALGWRRGRPTYCPARTSPTDEPVANPTGGPSPDPYATGPKKPWLNGAVCLCPEKEVKKRGLCPGLTGAAKAACIDDWAQNELPYTPTGDANSRPDSDVTDCRVVDDEQDGLPGVTAKIRSSFGSADIRTASHLANIFWGKIDLSGAKKHSGVGQDQPELKSANVACDPVTFLGGILCNTGSAAICTGYVDGERINPIDFVPLPAPVGGWTCETIEAKKASLFGEQAFDPAYWVPKYPEPDSENCKEP